MTRIRSFDTNAVRETAPDDKDPETLTMAVTGTLTVAGVDRQVEHQVRITRLDDETFRIRGKLDLKMSWFDMEPPTAFLGLLKAHDEFRVEFVFQAGIR